MGDLSPHFSRDEFVDARTGHYIRPPVKLLQLLEELRGKTGRPLVIVSGHRCVSTNRRVGGAPRSRHIAGDAVDLRPGVATVAEAARAGAVGIGERGGWAVHVDVRPGPAARWSYD